MSESNEKKVDLPEIKKTEMPLENLQPIQKLNNLNLSMIISSIVLGGSLILSASTLTSSEEPSNIIEYTGGKVEMGKVLAEEATFSFYLYDNNRNSPYSIDASSPKELASRVTDFFETSLNNENRDIDRNNKRKQERFDSEMRSYNRSLERYNKYLTTLDEGEQPQYDAPEKPTLAQLEENKKFKDMVLTISGRAVVSADIEFNGTTTTQFTLSLEDIEKNFTVEDKLSLPDLIEFIEDSADDLYSDYEDESLVS